MTIRLAAVALVVLVGALAITASPAVHAAGYVAPSRSVRQMVRAIGISNPKLTKSQRNKLATQLITVARAHNFDPLSGWAIIDHESDWRANAVSADGHDIGLAQIRYTVSKACRKQRDSKACAARRKALMVPSVNIRAMAGAITAWRKLCARVTGRPANMQNWLAGYGGYSRPRQQVYCGRRRVRGKKGAWRWKELPVPKAVADIVTSRKAMIRRLAKIRAR